jgi:membrane protease YdiL (CAAX protease family)
MAAPPRLPLGPALAGYCALLVAAVAWRTGLHGEPLLFASEAAAGAGLRPGRDLVLGVGCALGVALASEWSERHTGWGRRLAATLADMVGPLSPAACLVLAFASGIAEEAFFRGALQPRVGLVAASLLFGLVHFPAARALRPWTVLAAILGLGLGLMFESTGSLLAPVAAHVTLNAVGLWQLAAKTRRPVGAAGGEAVD